MHQSPGGPIHNDHVNASGGCWALCARSSQPCIFGEERERFKTHQTVLPAESQACINSKGRFCCIQARLQSLEEQQDGEVSASSAGVGTIAWRGQTSVVSAERLRVALGQALEYGKQVTSRRSPVPPIKRYCKGEFLGRCVSKPF